MCEKKRGPEVCVPIFRPRFDPINLSLCSVLPSYCAKLGSSAVTLIHLNF